MKSTPIRSGLHGYFGTEAEALQYLNLTRGKRDGTASVFFERKIGLFRVTEIPSVRPAELSLIKSAGTTGEDDGIWIRVTTNESAGDSASPATSSSTARGKEPSKPSTPTCRNCGRIGLINHLTRLCPLCS